MDINFRVGDTIRVAQKITEGDSSAGSGQVKTRIQNFDGIVIAINKNAKSFTVRKVSDGIGVERIWSFDSPWVESVTVKKKAGKIRKAKLYYLRNLTPKEVTKAVA